MHLYQSNRLELLCDALCEVLAVPLSNPLQPERIVIQNLGMAAWLGQQIAARTGIAANLQYPLPGRFFWQLVDSQLDMLPAEDPFTQDTLIWRIFHHLAALKQEQDEVAGYLADDHQDRKRYQLAARISNLFDQYQVYRPDMLAQWEKGEAHHWQARLWRQLIEETPLSRTKIFIRFLGQLANGQAKPEHLPERVCLFGVNALAPIYLTMLSAAAAHVSVHLFHLSPCREFWADIASKRQQAHLRRRQQISDSSSAPDYVETGNTLLASMGGQGKDFSQLLLELGGIEDHERYCPAPGTNLLQQVQNDILDLIDRSEEHAAMLPIAREDRSIQLHCCHSVLREVQVLHDRLLDLLAADPGIRPSDILVMAPNISLYTAAIQGTFGGADPSLRIPYSLADLPPARHHPVLTTFFHLLDLLGSRCTASDVTELFDCPALLARFGLHPSDRVLCLRWIGKAGIRWGLSRQHLRDLALDLHEQHTWRFGLDRLLLGYIYDSELNLHANLLPVPVALSDGAVLGGLAQLIHDLEHWRQALRRPAVPSQWQETLKELIRSFFAEDLCEDDFQPLHQALADFGAACSRAGCEDRLPLELVRQHLLQSLTEAHGSRAFLAGRLTFCNMVPMRSVPFRIICLLGMGQLHFPRNQQLDEFDLMARKPRPGDRNRRKDDRYLFLESLLSARDVLYLSWIGRSQTDNSLQTPSVVVGELIDYLDRAFAVEGTPAGQAIMTEHPLQPFSLRCFQPLTDQPSYARDWLPAKLVRERPPFLPLPLPSQEEKKVDFTAFCRFWKSPAAFFLRHRLLVDPAIRLRSEEDAEPFTLGNLELYQLAATVTSQRLLGTAPEQLRRHLLASGSLPQAGFADLCLEEIEQRSNQLLTRIEPLRNAALPPQAFAATGVVPFFGCLSGLSDAGRIAWRPARCNPTDLLELWLYHLMLNLLKPSGCPPISHHHGLDGAYLLHPVSDPSALLQDLERLYRCGLDQPLSFYPRTSFAWAAAAEDRGKAEQKALSAWQSNQYRHGDDRDPAYRLVLGDRHFLDTHFCTVAEQVFVPVIAHLEFLRAAP